MKCKNKIVRVTGIRYDGNAEFKYKKVNFETIITNDEHGKTLSINDGNVQFTIPFEPLQKYLK